jgi:hypothetical protein
MSTTAYSNPENTVNVVVEALNRSNNLIITL